MSDFLGDLLHLSRAYRSAGSAQLMRELGAATDLLQADRADCVPEYRRFVDVQRRVLDAPTVDLAGARVLVTGGTGCIGTEVLGNLETAGVQSITSVSRGLTLSRLPSRRADYRFADLRDRERVATLVRETRPDVVLHLGAVRNPAYAEQNPIETITTNVLGTRNVVDACLDNGVGQLVLASTGKAVRYYTGDVYAATKKVAEAIALRGACEGLGVAIARFTHVVDNSLIHAKLRNWLTGGPIELHDPHIAMFAQSARESAQLIISGVEPSDGEVRLLAMNDLGMYFELVDIALGMRKLANSAAPLLFVGTPSGYDSAPHPAQYDPATLDDGGPLLNAIEIEQKLEIDGRLACSEVPCADPAVVLEPHLQRLDELTRARAKRTAYVRGLAELGADLLMRAFAHAPADALLRARECGPGSPTNESHRVIDQILTAAMRRRRLTGTRHNQAALAS